MIVIIYFLLNAWYGTIDDTHQSPNQSCSYGLLWSQLNIYKLYYNILSSSYLKSYLDSYVGIIEKKNNNKIIVLVKITI